MPISPPPSDPADAGFTLVEMLVVLTIIGLVAAAGAMVIGRKPSSLARAEVANRVRSAAVAAGNAARTDGTPKVLDVSTVAGKEGPLVYASKLAAGQSLTFYPDGSATGGSVVLAGRPLVTIDWLTGTVADATP